MTLSLGMILWLVAVPIVLGAFALRALGVRYDDDRLGFVAWTIPSGALVLGLSLWAYVALGIEPWLWGTAPLFSGLLLALIGSRHRQSMASLEPRPRGGRGFVALAVIGSLWCVLQFVARAAFPSVEGDEGNIWSIKAKSLIVDWYGGDFAAAQVWNLHPDYPLLNPLLQAWTYSQQGELLQFENRLLIHLCVLGLWLAVCAALRRRVGGWLAGLLALTVLLAPRFYWLCRPSFADGMVALGAVLALDGWLRYRDTGHAPWLRLSALGAAFALWSKNEAALYAATVGIAALLAVAAGRARLRPPSATAAGALLIPLSIVAAQVLWNRQFALRNDLFGENPTGKSLVTLFLEQFDERATVVGWRLLELMFDVMGEFGVLLVLFLAPLLWPRAALGKQLFVPTLALIGSCVGLHLVYVGSHLDLERHMDTSHRRVIYQLVPVTLVWFSALIAQLTAPQSRLSGGARSSVQR